MRKIAVVLALCCTTAYAGEWTWDFNGNLDARDGMGDPLTPFGTYGFETDLIGGETAEVARFEGGIRAFRVNTPVGANGGGGYVNIYTLIMDVKFPAADWNSLYQTNGPWPNDPTNDGDWYLRGDGGLGISGDYDDEGNSLRFTYDEWHRIALVYDASTAAGDNEYLSYIDGELQNVVQGDFSIDGRWSLYPNDDPDYQWFYLFTEPTGSYVSDWGLVNSFQFRDTAATPEEIAALGGPTAAGIPEPATLGLLGIAALALLRRR
jgi:hypothetical protein